MKQMLVYIICMISPLAAFGQKQVTASYSKIHIDCEDGDRAEIGEAINGLPASVLQYVPKGYFVWDTCHGKLDMDGYDDMIVVLQQYNEDSLAGADEEKIYARPLLILLGQSDHTYRLVKRSDSAVHTHDHSGWGEFYTGITIKNGYFSIEGGIHGGRHHDETHTFKYNEAAKNWYLYKICTEDWFDDPDKPDEALSIHKQACQAVKDFGTVPFEQFNMNKED